MRPGQTVYFDDAEWVVVGQSYKRDGTDEYASVLYRRVKDTK